MRSDIRNQLYTGRNPVGAAGFLHCQQYSPQLLIPFISDIYFLLFKAEQKQLLMHSSVKSVIILIVHMGF